MITAALKHYRGLGPVRLGQLQEAGIFTWHDVINCAHQLPGVLQSEAVAESQRSIDALQQGNVRYFIDHFAPQDRWRILTQYLDDCAFFDIETTGLEIDDTITTIVCWHNGRLHTFVEHENLDDFLDLMDNIKLLVSFNGSTFDVPRVLDGFHIPELPCPHLDLRWPCHYQKLSGGLKQITTTLGISRPADLQDADGELAVRLWSQWQLQQNKDARDHLIRYCAADVLLLRPLAEHIAGRPMDSLKNLWDELPNAAPITESLGPREQRIKQLVDKFGPASPQVLRTRRRRGS